MLKKFVEVKVGVETLGVMAIVANTVRWMAIPLDQAVDQAIQALPESAFREILDGNKKEVSAQGFSLTVR